MLDSLAYSSLGTGSFALLLAVVFYFKVKAAPEGSATMTRIARHIREGSMAFLMRKYRVLAVYALVVCALLAAAPGLGLRAAVAFLSGASLSVLAGVIGMKSATYANARTAEAARSQGKAKALLTALDGGSVMGLCVAGLGLVAMASAYTLFRPALTSMAASPAEAERNFSTILRAFAFGVSSVALFARIGGGIYAKAAEVGVGLAEKLDARLPSGEARSPGVIADQVGENVDDVAGAGADIFESYVVAVVATMALGLTLPREDLQSIAPDLDDEGALREMAVALPLILTTVGLGASVVGIFVTRWLKKLPPAMVLRLALLLPLGLVTLGAAAALPALKYGWGAVGAVATGAVGGAVVGLSTYYYTSVATARRVANSSIVGSGANVIAGLAVGLESSAVPLLTLCVVGATSNLCLGLYGIALAAAGMLTCTATVMAVSAYGSIANNSNGISEMAVLGPEERAITDELNSAGNTAVVKGFAVGSAVLGLVALFAAFHMEINNSRQHAELPRLDILLTDTGVLMGLLFGAILPGLVGGATMTAVGRAAGAIVEELRRQFREVPGLLDGREGAEPQPSVIVDLATTAAMKELLLPALIAIIAPVFVGFVFGPKALAGTLVGSLAVGAALSLSMVNAGDAWNNAKNHTAHGISILIKVMGVVSLLIAPLIATR